MRWPLAPARSRGRGGHALISSSHSWLKRPDQYLLQRGFEHEGAILQDVLSASGVAGDEALCVSVLPPNLLKSISLTRRALLYFCCEDPSLTPW